MNYTSYRTAADSFKRDYPFSDNWATDTDIREWIGACLFELNKTSWLIPKVLDCSEEGNPCVDIENYKGVLPSDLVAIAGVKRVDGFYNDMVMPATDLFFMDKSQKGLINPTNKDAKLKFAVASNIITTSFETGTVSIAYWAIPTDDNGDLMIPDSEAVVSCCKAYLAEKVLGKLFLNGQVTKDKLDYVRQDLFWQKGKAMMDLLLPSTNRMDIIGREFNFLIRPQYIGYTGYKNEGTYRY